MSTQAIFYCYVNDNNVVVVELMSGQIEKIEWESGNEENRPTKDGEIDR